MKDAVNAWLKQNGFTTLHLQNTIGRVFRLRYEVIDPKYKSLSKEDLYSLMTNDPAFTEPRQDMIKRIQ